MVSAVERSPLPVLDELTGPTPRKAVLKENTRRNAFLFPLVFMIVLIITILVARKTIPQIRTRIALRSNTRLAIAQITSLHSGGRGVEIVEYTFNAAGKQTTGNASVPYYLFDTLRQSRQIIVRYRPSDPAINHPDAWEWSPGAEGFFGLLGLGCFWIAGIAGAIYPIHLLRLRTIILYGSPAIATILSSSRDRRVFSYRYTFRSADGIERTGKGSTTREIGIGESSWLLYLPKNPSRSCLYPSTEFEVNS